MPTNIVTGAQTLATIEKALKENYLEAFENQLGIEPSPLLAKIKSVPLKSNKIVATAPVGLSGGFGFGTEGAATPAAGNVRYERFETEAKDMYVNICLSAKAVRLTGSGGSMVSALDSEIKGAYAAAKWNMARALFGNGTGVLTTIKALSTAGNTIEVDDTKFLKEGIIVDIYATGGTSPQTGGAGRRIVSIDRANKTITLSGDAVSLGAGFITVQNSYNREITGLGSIFDSGVASIYGIEKASNPFLYPVEVDGNNDITESLITRALRAAKNEKGSDVDMLLCSDTAFDSYVDYMRTNSVRIEDDTLEGGFQSIKFIFGNKKVDVVNESMIPDGEIWGVETGKIKFHKQEWSFADLQGGGIFNLMENQSIYRALLVNYGDLICENPGGCIRIHNCV